MQDERFINQCFAPIRVRHPLQLHTGMLSKMSSINVYKDPKLNAQCLVILKRLDLTTQRMLEAGSHRKPRVFKIDSDSETENVNEMSMIKSHRQRRVKGTKRLFQLSDSEEDIDAEKDSTDTDLSSPLGRLALEKPTEFVVEKSISTPEGMRVLKSTVSSLNYRTEEINTLTQFKLCQVEEITLSSDDEEVVFSNTSILMPRTLTPTNESLETKKLSPEVDKCLWKKSDGTEDDRPTVPVPTTFDDNVRQRANESSHAIENTDEKLEALLASNRRRSKGKSTKPTSPRAISRTSRRAINSASRKISNKAPSMREIIKEKNSRSAYLMSLYEANKKNSSSTTPVAQPVHVHAASSENQKPLPAHKPSVPLIPPVKAKTTTISRGDMLAADLIDGRNQPTIHKKTLSTPRIPRQRSTIHPSNNSLLEQQRISKITTPELPKSSSELVSDNLNDSSVDHPPSNQRFKRVSRIPSNESTGGQATSQHGLVNSGSEDRGKQPTARTKANLALKSDIFQMKRSRDDLQGQGMKMVRVDGKVKLMSLIDDSKSKHSKTYRVLTEPNKIREQRFNG